MKELLQFMSIGIINLFGIMIPGLLFLIFTTFNTVFPSITLFFEFLNVSETAFFVNRLKQAYHVFVANKSMIIIFALTLSYVLGYLIRLWTVDDLDEKSANKVLKRMCDEYLSSRVKPRKSKMIIRLLFKPTKTYREIKEKKRKRNKLEEKIAAKDAWPYRRVKNDRFPYLYFKEYLLRRGLNALAKLVIWENSPNPSKGIQRSKAIINIYKVEIRSSDSTSHEKMSAIIESNEAHIRLMFGTWQVTKFFWKWALLFSLLFLATIIWSKTPNLQYGKDVLYYQLLIQLLSLFFLLWTKNWIEKLFHYQRVKELTQILGCASNVDNKNQIITRW